MRSHGVDLTISPRSARGGYNSGLREVRVGMGESVGVRVRVKVSANVNGCECKYECEV